MKEEVDRLKEKIEVVRKEVSVRPKNRVKWDRNGNGIEQIKLNNIRVRSDEGTGKQGEWIKVKGGRSKKIVY